MENEKPAKRGRGQPPSPDKVRNRGICLSDSNAEYLLKWCRTVYEGEPKSADYSSSVVEMIERCRKFWPDGPGKGVRPPREAYQKPGSKTQLNKELRELKARLEKMK